MVLARACRTMLLSAGGAAWRGMHRWAAVLGTLIPWLLLGVIAELDNPNRPDNTSGMALLALGVFLLLIILRVRLRSRETLAEEGGILLGEVIPKN